MQPPILFDPSMKLTFLGMIAFYNQNIPTFLREI